MDAIDTLVPTDFAMRGQVLRPEGLKRAVRWWLTRFPDLHVVVDPIVAEDDKVGIWYTATGTQYGECWDLPPTDQSISWVGFELFRLSNGSLTEGWFIADRLGITHQLGATLVFKSG